MAFPVAYPKLPVAEFGPVSRRQNNGPAAFAIPGRRQWEDAIEADDHGKRKNWSTDVLSPRSLASVERCSAPETRT
jgi:hypothetical protein